MRHARGFTLVEVLIVFVAALGIAGTAYYLMAASTVVSEVNRVDALVLQYGKNARALFPASAPFPSTLNSDLQNARLMPVGLSPTGTFPSIGNTTSSRIYPVPGAGDPPGYGSYYGVLIYFSASATATRPDYCEQFVARWQPRATAVYVGTTLLFGPGAPAGDWRSLARALCAAPTNNNIRAHFT